MEYKKEEIKEHLEDSIKNYDNETINELIKDNELHH